MLIYIRDEHEFIRQQSKHIEASQTNVLIKNSLTDYQVANMIFIDLEFDHEDLISYIAKFNREYLDSKSDGRSFYIFIYLFTNPHVSKQCHFIDTNGYRDYVKELDFLYRYYRIPEIFSDNVKFCPDINQYSQAPGSYCMGYWGYVRYGKRNNKI